MLEKYLETLANKEYCTEAEIQNLISYVKEESSNILKLIQSENMGNLLLNCTTKINDSISLNLGFILILAENTVYFKEIFSMPRLKQVFLSSTYKYREEHYENPFFELFLKTKSAAENFIIIMSDNELRKSFCISRHAGRDLIAFTKNNPSFIKEIILHSELKVAITEDRSHHMAIRDILYNSVDKKDADAVFSDSHFGGWHEDLKKHIYNVIAKNYRDSLQIH